MRRLSLFTILLFPTLLAAAGPESFTFLLQADSKHKTKTQAVHALRNCQRDWIILDATYDGTSRWSQSDIQSIRSARPNRKIICYLSIGEAETYRPYWHKHWDTDKDGRPDRGAPAWLDVENPDWEGNYKVRYWQNAWQEIILPEIDRIMSQGFGGLYLDIVDAFEFYEQDKKKYLDNRPNPETGNTYRQDMADWIKRITQRATRSKSKPLIIPQNAAQLLAIPSYRQTISGIGIEDLFTNGKKLKRQKESDYTLAFINQLKPSGKTVLIIDYAKKNKLIAAARDATQRRGFIFLNTDRPLKTLGQSP